MDALRIRAVDKAKLGGRDTDMKFAMLYNCGRDSTLAFERMVAAGHEPVCLVVALNSKNNRLHMHAVNEAVVDEYGRSLGLPLVKAYSEDKHDANAMLDALIRARKMGAEAICAGDIDATGLRAWNASLATEAGLAPVFPLWGADRRACIDELLDRGYKCVFAMLDRRILPERLLGQVMSRETLDEIAKTRADICGANGEYHTLVVDGQSFVRPLPVRFGGVRQSENGYSISEAIID